MDNWNPDRMDPDTIMIPNSQSSPTTGCVPNTVLVEQSYCENLLTNRQAEIRGGFDSLPYLYGSHNQDIDAGYMNHQPSQQLPFDYELPLNISSMNIRNNSLDADFPSPLNNNAFSNPLKLNQINENEECNHVDEDDKRASSPLMGIPKPLEDDYNWRKYGQKQVKGSEYPRSYYKCTHPNCDVKKKVEHAHDGRITTIIYKGSHYHPKPLPSRRVPPSAAFLHDDERDTRELGGSLAKIEDVSLWKNMNGLSEDVGVSSVKWTSATLDRELSVGKMSPGYEKYCSPLDSAANLELSSPPHGGDAEDEDIDETDSKRRRTDDCMTEPNMASRGDRETKIMLQAESPNDIIDDGYRWRKYGQKVVKGNPNPRSYYKCTSAGCLVRKHVERDPQNIKDVITTYEGKHNHDVPPSKNSNSPNKNTGHLPSVQSIGKPSHHPLSRSATMPKLEIPSHFSPHLERPSFPGNESLSPGLIGSFVTCMNFGASSMNHSDFPMPYGSLGLSIPDPDNIQQVGMSMNSPNATNLVIKPPLTLPRSLNSNMIPFDFNNGQGGFSQLLVHHPGHDISGVRPKQEIMDDTIDDSSASLVHLNKSSSLPPNFGRGFPY